MKRSSRHRNRHVPPGPCGVLWEMSKSKRSKSTLGEEEEEFSNRGKDQNDELVFFSEDGGKRKRNGEESGEKKGGDDQYDTSAPPAWTAMQRSLDVVTPYLPVWTIGNIRKRHELLRPHLPRNIILLPEILEGKYDLKATDPNIYLCVWVDSIEERNSHHGIWTVELKDETGASIRAWMEPNFVKAELQKAQQADETSSSKGIVRVGVVWMLTNFSMIAFHSNSNNHSIDGVFVGKNNNGGVIERMLVVSRKHIKRVWTPELHKAQNEPNEEDDSPEAQRKYLDWMEKRNALNVVDEEINHNVTNVDDELSVEEEPEMEKEKVRESCRSTFDRQEEGKLLRVDDEQTDCHRSHRRIVGDQEYQEEMTEISALTMTGDDENVLVPSQCSAAPYRFKGHRTATDGRNQPGMQIASTLADRNLNSKDSDGIAINNSCRRNHNNIKTSDSQASVLLHTQESCRGKSGINTKCDKSSSHPITAVPKAVQQSDHEVFQDDAEPLTQFDPALSGQENCESLSSPKLSSEGHPCDADGRGTLKDKKYEKKHEYLTDPNSSQNRTMQKKSTKSNRASWRSSSSSSICMTQSIWTTPDPSILKILEEEEDTEKRVEEEEVKTVIWEEPSATSCSIQLPVLDIGELKNATPDGPSGNKSHDVKGSAEVGPDEDGDEPNGDVSPMLTGVATLGENLFRSSNWAGMDAEAFSQTDSERMHTFRC